MFARFHATQIDSFKSLRSNECLTVLGCRACKIRHERVTSLFHQRDDRSEIDRWYQRQLNADQLPERMTTRSTNESEWNLSILAIWCRSRLDRMSGIFARASRVYWSNLYFERVTRQRNLLERELHPFRLHHSTDNSELELITHRSPFRSISVSRPIYPAKFSSRRRKNKKKEFF